MKQEHNELNGKRRRATRHLLGWCFPALFMVIAWVGCRQEVKIADDTDPAGTYTLVSVDGRKVPCTLTHEGATPTIKSGVFIIQSDGTCISRIAFSLPAGGDSSREVKATYTRQGQTLTMRWQGAGTTRGTVAGDTFTMNNEGMVFAYRK